MFELSMFELSMCGYRCDLCSAYVKNINNNDERKRLSEIWTKYYGLNISAEEIYCDGCRCSKDNAKRIDEDCPVRVCVLERQIEHCGYCNNYPCETFEQRQGLSCVEAKNKLNENFNQEEYDRFLLSYDNKNRLDIFKKRNRV